MLWWLALACASSPAPPPAAAVEEKRLTCPAPDRPLGASLFVAGEGKHPAAVVLVGAQPWDRYGDIPGGKAWGHYRDIARAIAAAGGAALLFDKGGTGETGGPEADMAQRVREAVAAVACARARPEVDPARVWLVGHSQGSVVAVQAAAEVKPTGLVLLSPVTKTAPAGLPLVVVRGSDDGGKAADAELMSAHPDARYVLVEDGNHLLMEKGEPRISDVATRAVAEAVAGKVPGGG